MCDFHLEWQNINNQFGIDSQDYFAVEYRALQKMEQDGLLSLEGGALQVSAAGRLLIRNIAMVFDKYLQVGSERRFSRVI